MDPGISILGSDKFGVPRTTTFRYFSLGSRANVSKHVAKHCCTLAPCHILTIPCRVRRLGGAIPADISHQQSLGLLDMQVSIPQHLLPGRTADGGGVINAPSSGPSPRVDSPAAGRSSPGLRVRQGHARVAARAAALGAAERSKPCSHCVCPSGGRLPRLSLRQPALGGASRVRFSSGRWVFKLSSPVELAAAAAAGHRPVVAAADDVLQHQGHGAARV